MGSSYSSNFSVFFSYIQIKIDFISFTQFFNQKLKFNYFSSSTNAISFLLPTFCFYWIYLPLHSHLLSSRTRMQLFYKPIGQIMQRNLFQSWNCFSCMIFNIFVCLGYMANMQYINFSLFVIMVHIVQSLQNSTSQFWWLS